MPMLPGSFLQNILDVLRILDRLINPLKSTNNVTNRNADLSQAFSQYQMFSKAGSSILREHFINSPRLAPGNFCNTPHERHDVI